MLGFLRKHSNNAETAIVEVLNEIKAKNLPLWQLYWYLTPKSMEGIVESAIKIAKRARRLLFGHD